MSVEPKADNDERERPTLRPGTVLRGKYRIDRTLGSGGMATVYAATHRNRKRFALKVLHPEFSLKRSVRSRFVREGYVANTVDHAGVVAVLDDDVAEDGSPFLVMELLEGATVDDLCVQGPLEPAAALLIVDQLLDVLDAAHMKAIVHRDIKPANLFVTHEGQLKVLDFGIARLRDATASIHSTRTGASLGTPAFMSPEQALALPDEVDARTDIWAVGATLFCMLTGKLVHEGDNARQLVVRAATEPPPKLESVAPRLPEPFRQLVDRALAFEKQDRWGSAAAMLDAVKRLRETDFAEFDRAALGELARAAHVANTVSAPTEPSPDSPPRPERAKTTRPEPRGAMAAEPASRVGESVASDTSKPVTGSNDRGGGRRGIRPVLAVAAVAGMMGVLFALAKVANRKEAMRQEIVTSSQPTPNQAPPATRARPTVPPAERAGPAKADPEPPLPADPARGPSTDDAGKSAFVTPPTKGDERPPARHAPKPAAPAAPPDPKPTQSSAAVVPTVPAKPDPLQIELQ